MGAACVDPWLNKQGAGRLAERKEGAHDAHVPRTPSLRWQRDPGRAAKPADPASEQFAQAHKSINKHQHTTAVLRHGDVVPTQVRSLRGHTHSTNKARTTTWSAGTPTLMAHETRSDGAQKDRSAEPMSGMFDESAAGPTRFSAPRARARAGALIVKFRCQRIVPHRTRIQRLGNSETLGNGPSIFRPLTSVRFHGVQRRPDGDARERALAAQISLRKLEVDVPQSPARWQLVAAPSEAPRVTGEWCGALRPPRRGLVRIPLCCGPELGPAGVILVGLRKGGCSQPVRGEPPHLSSDQPWGAGDVVVAHTACGARDQDRSCRASHGTMHQG